MKIPMTKRGAELLREELHRLKTVERPANSTAIGEARAHGDLSENAEYHAARERAGFIEGRISELEAKLGNAQVIDPKLVDADGRCVFGSTVDVEDEDGRELHLADRRRGRGRHQERPHLGQLADRARPDRQGSRAKWSRSRPPAASSATRSSTSATNNSGSEPEFSYRIGRARRGP